MQNAFELTLIDKHTERILVYEITSVIKYTCKKGADYPTCHVIN